MVSFDENVSYLSTSINLYERNEHFFFFKNETANELTGQTGTIIQYCNCHFYNSVTSKPGLITRTIVTNITRCVSLEVVFDLLSFYFSSLAD